MLNKYWFFVLSFGLMVSTTAQVISGMTYDGKTQSPVGNVHVGVLERGVNAVGAKDGSFSVNIPGGMEKDTFFISAVGYKLLKVPVRDILNYSSPGTRSFILSPMLPEIDRYFKGDSVVGTAHVFTDSGATGFAKAGFVKGWDKKITNAEFSSQNILQKALNKITANFITTTFNYEALYREYTLENTKCVKVLEAAVKIYDNGYNNPDQKSLTERVKVIELRRSNDYSTNPYMRGNGIEEILMRNELKYPRIGNAFVNNFNLFDFKLEKIEYYGQDLVYKVRVFNEPDKTYGEAGGLLYIRVHDLAIMEIQNFRKIKEGQLIALEFEVNIKYAEQNGKFYMSSINLFHRDNEIRRGTIDFSMAKKFELMVTKVNEEATGESISDKESALGNTDFYKNKYVYNSQFWQGYDALKQYPTPDIVTSSIGAYRNIEDQFNECAKHK